MSEPTPQPNTTSPQGTEQSSTAPQPSGSVQIEPTRPLTDAERQQKRRQKLREAAGAAVVTTKSGVPLQPQAADAAAAKKRAEDLKRTTDMCREAMTGTLRAGADAVHAIALRETDPVLDDERVAQLAEMWAPLIAPWFLDSGGKYAPHMLATMATISVVTAYGAEVRAARRSPRSGNVVQLNTGGA